MCSVMAPSVSPRSKRDKSVRWSTITVYEFGVAIGGSAIPKHGGPSIGLAKKPQCVWKTTVDAVSDDDAVSSSDDSAEDELSAMMAAANTSENNEPTARSLKDKTTARRRRVRWIKPFERVTMLTRAGCSEKRIYRMMEECSEIAMSRRLTLSVDRRISI
ncbi:TPA: hypothetical protein N0F65_010521 [Lagenidium giganteum]|uniref:Uncharacterized protein n=1 Tax=Lagenidium giganteum TaxID=4803 RepID=A0AAV2Z5R6_9STRA|nr:TPA: hypothetical protein N0F65_010521 [Lagenidium giganteum]